MVPDLETTLTQKSLSPRRSRVSRTAEIGSAYANHDQRVALGADPGRGGLDAGKLAGEHAVGQLKPARKVRAGSAPLRESAVGLFAFSPVGALVTPESGRAGQIYFYHVG